MRLSPGRIWCCKRCTLTLAPASSVGGGGWEFSANVLAEGALHVDACKGESRLAMLCVGTSLGARAGVGLAVGCKIGWSEDAEVWSVHALSFVSRRLLEDQAEPQCSRIRHGICASVTGVAAKVVDGFESHGSNYDMATGENTRFSAMNAWLHKKVRAEQGCSHDFLRGKCLGNDANVSQLACLGLAIVGLEFETVGRGAGRCSPGGLPGAMPGSGGAGVGMQCVHSSASSASSWCALRG